MRYADPRAPTLRTLAALLALGLALPSPASALRQKPLAEAKPEHLAGLEERLRGDAPVPTAGLEEEWEFPAEMSPWLSVLFDHEGDPSARVRAMDQIMAYAILNVEPEGAWKEPLARLLGRVLPEDPHIRVRRMAAVHLGLNEHPAGLSFLSTALGMPDPSKRDSSARVRRIAVIDVLALPYEELEELESAVKLLEHVERQDPKESIQKTARYNLRLARQFAELLRRMIRAPSVEERRQAMEDLRDFFDEGLPSKYDIVYWPHHAAALRTALRAESDPDQAIRLIKEIIVVLGPALQRERQNESLHALLTSMQGRFPGHERFQQSIQNVLQRLDDSSSATGLEEGDWADIRWWWELEPWQREQLLHGVPGRAGFYLDTWRGQEYKQHARPGIVGLFEAWPRFEEIDHAAIWAYEHQEDPFKHLLDHEFSEEATPWAGRFRAAVQAIRKSSADTQVMAARLMAYLVFLARVDASRPYLPQYALALREFCEEASRFPANHVCREGSRMQAGLRQFLDLQAGPMDGRTRALLTYRNVQALRDAVGGMESGSLLPDAGSGERFYAQMAEFLGAAGAPREQVIAALGNWNPRRLGQESLRVMRGWLAEGRFSELEIFFIGLALGSGRGYDALSDAEFGSLRVLLEEDLLEPSGLPFLPRFTHLGKEEREVVYPLLPKSPDSAGWPEMRAIGRCFSEALRGEDTHFFRAFAQRIPEAGALPAALSALRERLEHDLYTRATDFGVPARKATARFLGWCGDARVIGFLTEILQQDRSEEVRRVAAAALADVHSPQAAEALVRALQDSGGSVRKEAAAALAGAAHPEAAEALVRALEDEDAEVRRFSRIALSRIGGVENIPRILPLLDDYDGRVRNAAAEAIVRALPALRGFPPQSMKTAFTLHPEWVKGSKRSLLEGLRRRIAHLPPVGGKIFVLTDADGKSLRHELEDKLPPSLTAEEQAAVLLDWRRRGLLGREYVHQLTVQGRLGDDFKYAAVALLLSSPYRYDWTRPLFSAVWGRVAPLVHGGGQLEADYNPLWSGVLGRTDFLQRVVMVSMPELEELEAITEVERQWRFGEDPELADRYEWEQMERDRLLRESKVYQRLALAFHAHQGTAPKEIPEELRRRLAGHWVRFKGAMDHHLGEMELHGLVEVRWFLETPREIKGWGGPRHEADFPPVQAQLLEMNKFAQENGALYDGLRVQVSALLKRVTDDIDRDLSLLPPEEADLNAGMEEGAGRAGEPDRPAVLPYGGDWANITRGLEVEDGPEGFNGDIRRTLNRMRKPPDGRKPRVLVVGPGMMLPYELHREFPDIKFTFISKERMALADRPDEEARLFAGIARISAEEAAEYLQWFRREIRVHDLNRGFPEGLGGPFHGALMASETFPHLERKAAVLDWVKGQLVQDGVAFVQSVGMFEIVQTHASEFFAACGSQYHYFHRPFPRLKIVNQNPRKGLLLLRRASSQRLETLPGFPTFLERYQRVAPAGLEETFLRGGVEQLQPIFGEPPDLSRLAELRRAVEGLPDAGVRAPLLESVERIEAASAPGDRWLAVDEWVRRLNEHLLVPNGKMVLVGMECPPKGGGELMAFPADVLAVEWWDVEGVRLPVGYVQRLSDELWATAGITLATGVYLSIEAHAGVLKKKVETPQGEAKKDSMLGREVKPAEMLLVKLERHLKKRGQLARFLLEETRREEVRHLQMMRRVVPRVVEWAVLGARVTPEEAAGLLGFQPDSLTDYLARDLAGHSPEGRLDARHVQMLFWIGTEEAVILERLQAPPPAPLWAMCELLEAAEVSERMSLDSPQFIRTSSLSEVAQRMLWAFRFAGRALPEDQGARALADMDPGDWSKACKWLWGREHRPESVPRDNPARRLAPDEAEMRVLMDRMTQKILSAGLEEGTLQARIGELAEAAQGPGVLVIGPGVTAQRPAVVELTRRSPELAERVILFDGDRVGLVAELLGMDAEADRVAVLGDPELADYLDQVLPPSMEVTPLLMDTAFRYILAALGIPDEVLDQVDADALEGQLEKLRAA